MFLEADKAFKKYNTPRSLAMQARCWHDYALIYQFKGATVDYVNVLLDKAIPLAEKSGDTLYIAKNYIDLSFAFKNLEDFEKSEFYLLKCIGLLEQSPVEAGHILSNAYYTLAENYTLSGKLNESEELLKKMAALLAPFPGEAIWTQYYAARSMLLTVQKKYDQSLAIADQGIRLAEKLGLEYEKNRILLQQFYAYHGKGDYQNARKLGLSLAGNPDFMQLPNNQLQVYKGLAESFRKLNDPKAAYLWLDKFLSLNDSLYRSGTLSKIKALEVKYKTAQKERKIQALEIQKKEAALKQKNQRLLTGLLGTGAAVFLLALIFVYSIYKSNKRNNAHKLRELQQQKKLEVTQAILEGEESERQRLARDLHDGLGGALSGIKIKLSAEQENITAPIVGATILQLENAIAELRRIARNMMPETLIRSGLEAALRDLCVSLSSVRTIIEFQPGNIQKSIPVPAQVNIYRIIQELLANAIRHGQATLIIVQCMQQSKHILITVEDNGTGFDLKDQSQFKGAGFNNIRNRISLMKGGMHIDTMPGDGTTVNIELYV